MSDLEDEYLASRHIQKILLEAATDLAKLGSRDGVYPCGSASSQHVTDNREHFGDQTDESCVLRRAFSSPAIPELGRELYEDLIYRQIDDVDNDRYSDRERERLVRMRRAAFAEERAGSRDLSPNGSYELVHLDEADYEEGDRPRARSPAADGERGRTEARFDSDSEGSYLEDSSPCTGRPIIRILDDIDEDGGGTHRSDPGPLDHAYRRADIRYYQPGADREALIEAEKYIAYLNQVIYKVKAERNELMELHKFRSKEWMELKKRLRAEIVQLRDRNTKLMCEKMNAGGRMSKQVAESLIRAKQDSDRALATTLERQQKINELRLLVTMQQRYILSMEDTVGDLQRALVAAGGEDEDIHHMEEGSQVTKLPMRHPAETQVLSEYQDVVDCDRSNYIPGTTTDPELASAEIFNFPGERLYHTEKKHLQAFDMLKVPYVRGALSSAT